MSFKIRPIFQGIAITYFTEALVMIAFFILYKLIALHYGPEGVGQYSLIKRVLGFFQPLLMLGLGIGLPRYISMSPDKTRRSSYIKVGGLVIVISTFIFLLSINIFNHSFSKMFFGSIDLSTLVLPFSLFFAGLTLHTLIYSYFRGTLSINTFNFLQIINLALIPILIVLIFSNKPLEKVISLTGIFTLVISLGFCYFLIEDILFLSDKPQLKKSFKELFYYSLPRVPGGFAQAGLLSLGPIFAAHFTNIKEVGYLSVSQSLLTAMGVGVAPLGAILLPKVGNMIAQGRNEEIKENLNYLMGATIQCSIFIVFQSLILTDIVIKYWLGPDFSSATPVMRIVFLSLFFYFLCGPLGSILEASKVKPINTINIFISLGIFITLSGILLYIIKLFSPLISITIAFTVGLIILGIMNYISTRKIYPEKLNKDLNYLWIAIGINIFLGLITFITKPLLSFNFYYLIIFEILLGFLYLSILWLLKADWLRKIPEKIMIK